MRIQSDPHTIPVPGGKVIEEFFGKVSTDQRDLSIAHMIAPAGWSEPSQTPKFDEYTIVIRGKMSIQVNGDWHHVSAGSVILTEAGETVRYANKSESECEYWAICKPAFSPETVNRIEE